MPIRDLRLPADLISLGDLLFNAFDYPENPEWSVKDDEQEQIATTIQNLARIWPIIRVGQLFSTALRNLIYGSVWEEDGKMVGCTTVQPHGATSVWVIGTVGVLPEYRRRGIARKLVERGLEIIGQKGGKKAWLDVIDGNLPAYQLYESLGFETYSGHIDYQCQLDQAPALPQLPAGFTQLPLKRFDWQPRYQLEKRISPENLRQYEPVEEGRFRQSGLMRLIAPLIIWAQGSRDLSFQIHNTHGQIVARMTCSIPKKGGGVNAIFLRHDPHYPELAAYMLAAMLHQVLSRNPGSRVELSIPVWQPAIIAAAEDAGFEKRVAFHRMGLVL